MRDILEVKGGEVISIAEDATVMQAALLMNQRRVGSLVVMGGGQVVGIFTERDVLRRVVAECRDPEQTLVSQVMSPDVICCHLDTSLDEARSVFKNRRIRHLPVVDADDALVGVVSIGDLNAYHADSQEVTIHYLHEYIYGRT
jgi:CBS domain-containing protein